MQVKFIGQFLSAQQLFQKDNFRKQTIIVAVTSGSYTNYYPVDFINDDIEKFGPQLQMGGSYEFTCYVEGSRQQQTDKNGQPTAYVNLKAAGVVPAQQAAPQPQQGFAQPAQQTFSAPATQQGFATPSSQQGGFGQPPAQQGFGQSAPTQQGFGNPQPQQQSQPFGNQPAPGGFGQPG